MREKLFVSEGSVHGVSVGESDTMRCEFDEDGTMHVSDVCLHATGVVDAATHIGQVRSFLDLALPYTLPLLLCTTRGILSATLRPYLGTV